MSKHIAIAQDFTRTPGARFKSDGGFSGEEFREKFLEPLFKPGMADEVVTIELDGTEGFATSFLEEAFGGLARQYGKDLCLRRLRFVSVEDPLLIDEINQYIANCDAH